MHYGLAREVLGLEDGDEFTERQLRRRYLRKLKDHPPERDPEGFQKLREAFEYMREYADADVIVAREAPAIFQFSDQAAPSRIEAVAFEAPPAFVPLVVTPAPEPLPRELIVLTAPEPPPVVIDPPPAVEPPRVKVFDKKPEIIVLTAPEPPRPPDPIVSADPIDDPDPPVPLTVLVPKIIELLEAGHVDTALELENDWRIAGDSDDFRQSDMMIAAHWAILRELLGVAAEIPVAVVQIYARCLRTHDYKAELPALEAYRLSNKPVAEKAHVLMTARASSIYRNTPGALWKPEPVVQKVPVAGKPDQFFIPPPPPAFSAYKAAHSSTGSSGSSNAGNGLRILMIVVGLCLGLARIMSTSNTTPSYRDYDSLNRLSNYTPPPPIDMKALDELSRLSQQPLFVPPPPPAFSDDHTPEMLWAQLAESAQALQMPEIASLKQISAAAILTAYILQSDCKASRRALKKLDSEPPIEDITHQHYAAEHLEAIHGWLDEVCSPKKKPVKKKP